MGDVVSRIDQRDTDGVRVTAGARSLPWAEAIVAACKRATAHNHGQAVREHTVSPACVAVRLSSWPRLREALRELQLLGYDAQEDTGAAGGHWLVVVGWSIPALRARAARLERAAVDMVLDGEEWSGRALRKYKEFRDECGVPEDDAEQRALDLVRREIAELPGSEHVFGDVAEEDRSAAAGEVAQLLGRVAEAERMLWFGRDEMVTLAGAVIRFARATASLVCAPAGGSDDDE